MSITALAALTGALLTQTAPSISDVWQSNLKDLSFTAVVQSANQAELGKINRDFANSYRFKSSSVRIKEPFMLRMESKVDDMDIFFIVNGPTRTLRIPRAGINRRENLATAPGKRQTWFDFGMITPSLFDNFFVAKFVRRETRGDNAGDLVFDLTYAPGLDDSTRNRIWVDPAQRLIAKREWYSQNGGFLVATFVYDQPKQFGGIWLPTRAVVRNAQGRVAGTTAYRDVKVNTGLATSVFTAN